LSTAEPQVSIVMPVFNSDRWLMKAIASIKAQSFPDFELIVIDDGSTDQTAQIVADAVRSDGRIRTARQDHRGIAAALNNGIALARSQIVARMDGDDIAAADRLQAQLAFLVAHPAVAGVGSWAYVIDEQDHRIGELKPATEPTLLHGLLLKQNPFVHSSMMLRTDAIRSVGGYRPALDGAEDYDLWLRMSERAQFANIPQFLLSYRSHPASANAASARRQLLAARLARLSATARRASQPDFADTLEAPLNLDALRNRNELRATAELYDLLSRRADSRFAVEDFQRFGRTELNHAERKAAQFWLKGLLTSQRSLAIRSMALFWLLRLHPARGLSLIWSALRGR
jgi:glycosyltransferase involved in cell wall biosynthesis